MATDHTTSQAAIRQEKNRRRSLLTGALIAMVGLAVCALGISAVMSKTRSDAFEKRVITATGLAREMLERIKSADYDAVIAANYPQEGYRTIAAHDQFRRTVIINEATPEPSTKTITVTVSWRDSTGIVHHVPLSTIIAK